MGQSQNKELIQRNIMSGFLLICQKRLRKGLGVFGLEIVSFFFDNFEGFGGIFIVGFERYLEGFQLLEFE